MLYYLIINSYDLHLLFELLKMKMYKDYKWESELFKQVKKMQKQTNEMIRVLHL